MTMQYVNDKSVSVGNTNTVVLSTNLNRVAYSITNTSVAVNISVAKGTVAVDKKGSYLTPNGGSTGESTDSHYQCWTGEVSAIGDAAGPTTLAVSETIQVD